MSQADLFGGGHLLPPSREQDILDLWKAGRNLDEIASAFDISPMRACHELNLVLNARCAGVNFSKWR